jgi:hypothetical protein
MNWVAEHQWNNLQERLGFSGSSEGLEDALYLKLKTLRKQSGRMPRTCDSCRFYKPDHPTRAFQPTGKCGNPDGELFDCPVDWQDWCIGYEKQEVE